MNTIVNLLEELCDTLTDILPLGDPTEIRVMMTSLVEKAQAERARIEKENEEIARRIEEYKEELGIEDRKEKCQKTGIRKKELENEMRRIEVYREKVRREMDSIKTEIEEIGREIGEEVEVEITKISVKKLEELREERERINREHREMEGRREHYKKEIESYEMKMGVREVSRDEEGEHKWMKIGELKRRAEGREEEYKRRRKEVEEIKGEIGSICELIFSDNGRENNENDGDSVVLSDGYLDELRTRRAFLKEEQKRLFDEIFDRSLGRMEAACSVLGLAVPVVTRDEKGLNEMKSEIERLVPMGRAYVNVMEKIASRRALLEKMTEFEKVASDPRRLFKSSFQLISEEKFRNSAYPSLIKLEEEILEEIEEYEREYGEFAQKKELKREIENRIINKTVFISRCDSPYRGGKRR